MEPKELRENINTLSMWRSLVAYWSEQSRCSAQTANRDLVSNSQGDYEVFQEEGTWFFINDLSGERARWDVASEEWVFVELMGSDDLTKGG